jgi:sugar phosphate isomerase/epimerase
MEPMLTIGIMQGRLSNKINLPLQSFPKKWQSEFKYASQLGLKNIEWLFDETFNNPISTDEGRKQIRELSRKYNIEIVSLCAHKFIDGKLFKTDQKADEATRQLNDLITYTEELKIKHIILPVMDALSIKSRGAKDQLKDILRSLLKPSSSMILLESDLPMKDLNTFIEDVSLDNVKVLYDLGNSTANKHDLVSEIYDYHSLIAEIHVKDRYHNGSSDRLGCADVNFDDVAWALKQVAWSGPVILETPVFDNWMTEAEHNISFAKNWIDKIVSTEEGDKE